MAAAAALLRANDGSLSNGVIVGRLGRTADAAGTTAETGNGRLNLARALSDTSTDGVKPAGAPGGGPLVGPYVAAARNLILTFSGTGGGSVTVTPNSGTVNAPVSCGGTGTATPSQTVTSTCAPNITTSDNGATVTFTATANGTSAFAGWSAPSALSSSTCTGTTNPCSAVLGGGPALTVTFNGGTPDLTVTKADSPDPIVSGNALTYTIVVSNGGTASAAAVSLTDVLPAALTGAKFCTGPACDPSTGAAWTSPQSLGAIVAGGSVTVKIQGTVTGCSNLSNTATVSTTTTESNTANNSSGAIPTTVQCADLTVTKADSPDPIVSGNALTYTIVVSNGGTASAAAVSLTDVLPAALTGAKFCTGPACDPSTGAAWTSPQSLGAIVAGGSVTVTRSRALSRAARTSPTPLRSRPRRPSRTRPTTPRAPSRPQSSALT